MAPNLQVFALVRIKRLVADNFGVSGRDLVSEKKTIEIYTARQIGYLLCRELTNASLQRIGRVFGKRDHTTVMHGITKAQTLIKNYPAIANRVARIKEDFNNDDSRFGG